MSDPGVHPIDRQIRQIQIPNDAQGNPMEYIVGVNCTRIEACSKNGMHCSIPYIRVWNGQEPIVEVCEHYVAYVFFGESP